MEFKPPFKRNPPDFNSAFLLPEDFPDLKDIPPALRWQATDEYFRNKGIDESTLRVVLENAINASTAWTISELENLLLQNNPTIRLNEKLSLELELAKNKIQELKTLNSYLSSAFVIAIAVLIIYLIN